MEEDAKFYKLLANVDDKKKNINKTNSAPKLVDAKEFWSKVDIKYVKKLAKPFAYKYDFELFGYSIQEYAEKVGINLS